MSRKKNKRRVLTAERLAEHGSPEEAGHFFNRDVSWLEFNRRVLAQADRQGVPVLERAKFLAIYANNLDEFFMKRVGLLKLMVREGAWGPGPPGSPPPQEQLQRIRESILALEDELARSWERRVLPGLREAGIHVLRPSDLTGQDNERLRTWHRRVVFPVLTPLAVDRGHRFPFISNLSMNLGVMLSRPGTPERGFARVKIPAIFPSLVPVDDPFAPAATQSRFAFLDDIVANNLDLLFPGMEIHAVMPFRVTRSAEVELDDHESDDLLEHVERELRQRRFASVIRLEVPPEPAEEVLDFLRREMDMDPGDIYERRGMLDYTDLLTLAEIDRPDLRERPWVPVSPARLSESKLDMFAEIRHRDLLVHHPYESFRNSVERFIAAAARDPDVLAIKLTLYRTSPDAAFISSLIRAAENGKQIACLVELRARFDEHRNLRFARQLEKAGVHVAYGVVGLKTHCKCSLVVRQETDGIRCYAHVGTGNYHPKTAQLYTDFGLFTADTRITGDVVQLFNYLTGHSDQHVFDELIVAPEHMRARFCDLIDAEIAHARAGRPARIVAKMNSLEDRRMTQRLYEASGAGVDILLIVRGFCCLRPGVPGMSENIRVISVVGRFLEHSRVYHFSGGKENPIEGDWYIGSADWMYRNLNRRVELCAPVYDPLARSRLAHLIDVIRRDHVDAWDLQPNGVSVARTPPPDAEPGTPEAVGTFASLMRETIGASVLG